MGYQTLSLGLTLTIPTAGTRNWAQTLYSTTWTKISSHDHSGSGNGAQLGTNAILNLSITTGKIADLAITTIKIADLNVTTAKIADNAITSAKIAANLGFKQAAALTPVGTTETINWNNGVNQILSLASATGNVALTLSNPIEGAVYRIRVQQGATARDITWPAEVKWPQGQKPILSTGSGDIDFVELYYDGTNYLADWQVDYS